VAIQAGRDGAGGLVVAACPPAANSAASVLPMVPVPMMATVLSEIATVVHLS
jgi:hypothetical protein